MSIGLGEIFVLVLVLVCFVRPGELQGLAKRSAKVLAKVRHEGAEFAKEFREPVNEVLEPLSEVKKEVQDTVEELTSLGGKK